MGFKYHRDSSKKNLDIKHQHLRSIYAISSRDRLSQSTVLRGLDVFARASTGLWQVTVRVTVDWGTGHGFDIAIYRTK